MDEKSVLTRMVGIATKAHHLSEMLRSAGYENNPYVDIHGEAADAIYYMLGEHTDNFDESVTSMVLSSDHITDEQRVTVLSYHYRKNHALA